MTMLKSRLPSQKEQQKMREAKFGEMSSCDSFLLERKDLRSMSCWRYRRQARKKDILSAMSDRWEMRLLAI